MHRREPWPSLEPIPVLALLTLFAALTDVAINGVALRTLGGALPRTRLLALAQWGELARNLVAIAGIVAMGTGLVAFLRYRRWAGVTRRVILAGFAGVVLPIVLMATWLSPELFPHDHRAVRLIKLGVGAANVLAVLIAHLAIRRVGPRNLRLGLLFFAASCFLTFAGLALGELRWVALTHTGLSLVKLVRQLAEAAFLAGVISVVVALVIAAVRELREAPSSTRERFALGAGAAALLTVGGTMIWGRAQLGADFAIVLYGAQRMELLADTLPTFYIVPCALGAAAAANGLTGTDPWRRQAGAGLLLILAAGVAPRAPAGLVTLIVAMVMLARASVFQGERGLALAGEGERDVGGLAAPHSDPPV